MTEVERCKESLLPLDQLRRGELLCCENGIAQRIHSYLETLLDDLPSHQLVIESRAGVGDGVAGNHEAQGQLAGKSDRLLEMLFSFSTRRYGNRYFRTPLKIGLIVLDCCL